MYIVYNSKYRNFNKYNLIKSNKSIIKYKKNKNKHFEYFS